MTKSPAEELAILSLLPYQAHLSSPPTFARQSELGHKGLPGKEVIRVVILVGIQNLCLVGPGKIKRWDAVVPKSLIFGLHVLKEGLPISWLYLFHAATAFFLKLLGL
jgi:hypothetical protein